MPPPLKSYFSRVWQGLKNQLVGLRRWLGEWRIAALLKCEDLSWNLQNPHKVRLSSTLNTCNPVVHKPQTTEEGPVFNRWRVRTNAKECSPYMCHGKCACVRTHVCARKHTHPSRTNSENRRWFFLFSDLCYMPTRHPVLPQEAFAHSN